MTTTARTRKAAAPDPTRDAIDPDDVMPGVAAGDVDVLYPAPGETLEIGGIDCRIRRIKTRELLHLMRILTVGLGPALTTVRLDFSSSETVQQDMMGLLILALPNATDETFVFLAGMVEAVNGSEQGSIGAYMHDNPEPDELIDIFEVLLRQEAPELVGLAGKAQAMWSRVGPLFSPTKTNTAG